MPSRRNAVQRAFDAFGRTCFKEKRSGAWVRRFELVEHRVWLQKSQYGLSYFINLEIAFGEGDGDWGAIEGRVEALLGGGAAGELRKLLDMDGAVMTDELREHRLLELLTARVGPELTALETPAGIVDFAGAGRTRMFGVTGPAREILLRHGVDPHRASSESV